jgi:hypothetical protein
MCGKNQNVSINTRPPGADVVILNKFDDVVFKGVTPCEVSLPRGDADRGAGYYKVTVQKTGYTPFETELQGKVNRAYLANVMNGCIGMITLDPYTGAKWTLVPMEINEHLIETGK